MRVAEGQAALDQVVGQVGGGGVALQRGGAHGVGLDRDAGHHVGEDAQRVDHRVDRVEQRFLVFLVVLVVGQRLALHQREQADQVAVDAAGLAARQFRHVGVLLLRHDRAAGAEAVGDVDEAHARAHPQHQLFREARDVRHHQRGGGAEFDGEVAVRHRIQRVAAHAVEAQLLRDEFAVDRVARAGQRGGAQRQAVDPLAGVEHALGVAREHLDIGQQVVAEHHRLRDLQVREAGDDGVGVLLGQVQQGAAQGAEQADDIVDLAAQPQADVGGDLVVARAAGVQALAGVARHGGQARFDVQVHVFQVQLPLERAGFDLLADLRHALLDGGAIGLRDDALLGEHGRVRERALDVEQREALVEEYRGGIALDEVGHRLVKAGGPRFGLLGELGGHGGQRRRAAGRDGPAADSGNRDYIVRRPMASPALHGPATARCRSARP